MYSVRRITDGAWMESFCEWSIWPLCSSTRAKPLKIMTTARLSVHTLMGSKEVFRTKTLPFICGDITRARKKVSKICCYRRVKKRGRHPCDCRGGPRWPPVLRLNSATGGHGGPPLQLRPRDR